MGDLYLDTSAGTLPSVASAVTRQKKMSMRSSSVQGFVTLVQAAETLLGSTP